MSKRKYVLIRTVIIIKLQIKITKDWLRRMKITSPERFK